MVLCLCLSVVQIFHLCVHQLPRQYLIAQLDNLCCCSLGLCTDCDFHTQITRKSSTAMCYITIITITTIIIIIIIILFSPLNGHRWPSYFVQQEEHVITIAQPHHCFQHHQLFSFLFHKTVQKWIITYYYLFCNFRLYMNSNCINTPSTNITPRQRGKKSSVPSNKHMRKSIILPAKC